MNSFVKTKDKSQKKRRRIDASRSLRNQRRQQEEEDKSTVVVLPQEAIIDWFFSVLFMHSRACDYNRLLLYSRPRMLYRIQTCE